MQKADVKFIYSRYLALKQDREEWADKWEETAKLFYPNGFRKSGKVGFDYKKLHTQSPDVLDSTSVQAANTLASGMYGAMTSPSRPWFTLRPQGFELDKNYDAKIFIDEVENRMRVILLNSKFYNTMHEAYRQLGVFGTACVYGTADMTGMRFDCLPCGTYVFDVDRNGRIDTVIRTLSMSVRQMQMEFGEENLPERLRTAERIKKNAGTERYEVFHAVMPREDSIKNGMFGRMTVNPLERPFASVYFMPGERGANGEPFVLKESGFDLFPYFPVRWDVVAGEVYGISPAMNSLPDAKMVQSMNRSALKAAHLSVNPPLVVSAELQGKGINCVPGGVTYISSSCQGGQAISSLYQVHPDYNGMLSMMDKYIGQIERSMFVDLFRMFSELDRRQITATEITAREQEKLVLIGHVLERLQDELFNPLIEWLYFNMSKYNMLPEAPESLQGRQVKVEYTSAMAQAQKIAGTSSIEQFTAFLGNLAGVNPDVLDTVDFDEAVNKYAESLGVDTSLMRSDDEISRIRQQRQQQQEQQQTQVEMANAANMAQQLGNTPAGNPEQPTALDAVIGGLGAM